METAWVELSYIKSDPLIFHIENLSLELEWNVDRKVSSGKLTWACFTTTLFKKYLTSYSVPGVVLGFDDSKVKKGVQSEESYNPMGE